MRPAQETIDIRRDLVSLLPRLRRFARTVTHSPIDADDLVQSVCDRATAAEPFWNGRGRLEGALYTLARTIAAETAGKRKVGGERDRMSGHLPDDTTKAGAAHRLLLALPDGLSSVFLLVVVEGHAYDEAGEILGIPPLAVAKALAAARVKLAALSAQVVEKRA